MFCFPIAGTRVFLQAVLMQLRLKIEESQTRRAVFLENDGAVLDPILPETLTGLRLLHQAGYLLVILSNQTFLDEVSLHGVERRLRSVLSRVSIPMEEIYYTSTGLILDAVREHHINPGLSWVVGDRTQDVEAGRRAGCRTILLDEASRTERSTGSERAPDYEAQDLMQAAWLIVSTDRQAERTPAC